MEHVQIAPRAGYLFMTAAKAPIIGATRAYIIWSLGPIEATWQQRWVERRKSFLQLLSGGIKTKVSWDLTVARACTKIEWAFRAVANLSRSHGDIAIDRPLVNAQRRLILEISKDPTHGQKL